MLVGSGVCGKSAGGAVDGGLPLGRVGGIDLVAEGPGTIGRGEVGKVEVAKKDALRRSDKQPEGQSCS